MGKTYKDNKYDTGNKKPRNHREGRQPKRGRNTLSRLTVIAAALSDKEFFID